ncbi:MAG: hypothetical protein AB7T27_01195 [Kiritimatiellia bacterium]
MESMLHKNRTRFRAYQLGSAGSSFSYFDGAYFTLIEARLTDVNRPRLKEEMKACGVTAMSCLHITSWDTDHCAETDLGDIIRTWGPAKIEYPGYEPSTDAGKKCLKIIKTYKDSQQQKRVIKVDPPYIDSLKKSRNWGYENILYWPRKIDIGCPNNNSTAKFFRTGCFNVLSLGDLESPDVASYFKCCTALNSETDIMILAHHGADSGFTTKNLLKRINPSVAICSSNFDNQFEHPRQEIRNLLNELEIPIFTTKTGDIIIESIEPHIKKYVVWNLISDSTVISSRKEFMSRKSHFLENTDRATNHYNKQRNPFKRFY